MADYINREALIKRLIAAGAICDWGLYIIKSEPAVDVRLERYGEWRQSENGHVICTCCNGVSDELYAIHYSFCPNCGARMVKYEKS